MVRLIVGVLILVLLAVLFAMNGANVTDLNLFGYQAQNVPVIAVAVAGFVLGVLYSFVLYLMRFLARRRKAALQSRDRAVRDRERSLQDRERELETMAEDLQSAEPAGDEPAPQAGGRRRARR